MLTKIKEIIFYSHREPFPDFLRGTALILMIQVHLTELLLIDILDYKLFIRWSLFFGSIPAAPIFLILMGYYLAKSSLPFKQEIVRAIKLFLLGLTLNILMNFSLLLKFINREVQIDPFQYILGADILLFASLSILLIAFIKQKTSNINIYAVLILLSFILGGINFSKFREPILFKYFLHFFFPINDWSYFPLFPWFAYPLTGFILSRFDFLNKLKNIHINTYIWAVYLLILILTYNFGFDVSNDLSKYYGHNFLFYLWGLYFLFGWVKLLLTIFEKFIDNFIIQYIKWLGKNVTIVYFFQWILIGNIATYLYHSLTLENYFIELGLILLIISICTYLYSLSKG